MFLRALRRNYRFIFLYPIWLILILGVTVPVLAQQLDPDFWVYLPIIMAQQWSTMFVDSPRYFSDLGARAVQFKDAGRPCLVYGNDHLYYSCWNGVQWVTQTADSDIGVGRYATLAFDSHKNPGIAYYDETNGMLRYAYWDGSQWRIELVDDPAALLSQGSLNGEISQNPDNSVAYRGLISHKQGVGGYASIAFDSADQPRISYYDFSQQDLKYAAHSAGGWQINRVDSTGIVGLFTSIAVNLSGEPSIAYYDATNKNLKLATRNANGIWTQTIVDSTGDVGLYASYGLSSANQPRIAYYDATNKKLKYWEGGTPQVLNYSNIGQFASLRLDAQGQPWISFYNEGNINLGLVHRTAQGSWVYQTIDTNDMVGRFVSLALESNGRAGMVYYHSSNCQLRYAEGSSSFTIHVLDTNTITGIYTDIAVAGTQPRIVYLNDSQSRLMYAALVNGTWKIETISRLNDTGVHPSLAIGPDQDSHVAFWQYQGGTPAGIVSTLRYTSRGSDGWGDFEIVDQGVGIGFHSSLAIDPSGKPHVSYYDDGNGNLKYASKIGGSWMVQTVDQTGDVGDFTSLALDSAGWAWISYYDWQNGTLKVAHQTSGGWKIYPVDSVGKTGIESSIAIDPDGSPVVAYRDADLGQLKLAVFHNGGWSTEVIDSVGSAPSIYVKSTGNVFISYYDQKDYNLKFAYQTNSGWIFEIVDFPGDVGMFNALAYGADNQFHVAYLDATNGDLKYAFRKPIIP